MDNNNLLNQQTEQPIIDNSGQSIVSGISSSQIKENAALPVKKRISNKLLLFIFIPFFMFMIVIIIGFVFLVKSDKLGEEKSFVEFVQKSIVQNETPQYGWVNNTVKQDPTFLALLSSIRGITQTGGYTQVSSYGECKNILNEHEYVSDNREEYCAVKLCKDNNTDCIYLVGYKYSSSTKSGASTGSITSFDIFETKDEIDNEIKTLLQG